MNRSALWSLTVLVRYRGRRPDMNTCLPWCARLQSFQKQCRFVALLHRMWARRWWHLFYYGGSTQGRTIGLRFEFHFEGISRGDEWIGDQVCYFQCVSSPKSRCTGAFSSNAQNYDEDLLLWVWGLGSRSAIASLCSAWVCARVFGFQWRRSRCRPDANAEIICVRNGRLCGNYLCVIWTHTRKINFVWKVTLDTIVHENKHTK